MILRHFSLAPGTGGKGLYKGGDGVRREILFRKDLFMSVLSERRVLRPYGLCGGEDGASGVNLLVKSEDGGTLYLGGKCSVPVKCGDVFVLQTPGGGGWGDESTTNVKDEAKQSKAFPTHHKGGSLYDYEQMQLSA